MVAFEEGEGPWTLTKGNECGVQVLGLKDGESLHLETDSGSSGTSIQFSSGVTAIFPANSKRYRFVKKVPEGIAPSKTSVEVLING